MSEPRDRDEFYVGYLPKAPRGIGKRTRFAVGLFLLIGVVVALALLRGQTPFASSRFEFGVVREFQGVVRLDPHPILLVERPGADAGTPASQYLLVAFGKFGARDALPSMEGQPVRLEGSLIYRDGKTMTEIAGGSVQPLDGSEADRLRRLTLPADEAVGRVTLMGEIVDSKCFWGVMKPGNLKPHRACAVRCISGGIPPLFLVRDEDGETRQFLLVGAAGEPVNDRILDRIAEPLEITGRLTRRGDLLILSADPDTYRRR